jgi:DNA adenine methylase
VNFKTTHTKPSPTTLQKARPVIAWPGGKTRLLRHILPHLPPHRTYCEVFGGGLAVFCAKPPSEIEVINDISSRLIAFYRVVKYHLPTLIAEIGLTEIQQVARWYLCQKLSFGGQGRTFAPTRTRPVPRPENRLTALETLSQRLSTVTIENLDWSRFFTLYDYPEACHFCDPPYFADGGSAYDGWSEEQFATFARRLKTLRGSWILTYQDCPQVRDQFRDCRVIPVSRPNSLENRPDKIRNKRCRELIIFPR